MYLQPSVLMGIGLSDYRAVGLSGRRTTRPSDYRAVGLLGLNKFQRLDKEAKNKVMHSCIITLV